MRGPHAVRPTRHAHAGRLLAGSFVCWLAGCGDGGPGPASLRIDSLRAPEAIGPAADVPGTRPPGSALRITLGDATWAPDSATRIQLEGGELRVDAARRRVTSASFTALAATSVHAGRGWRLRSGELEIDAIRRAGDEFSLRLAPAVIDASIAGEVLPRLEIGGSVRGAPGRMDGSLVLRMGDSRVTGAVRTRGRETRLSGRAHALELDALSALMPQAPPGAVVSGPFELVSVPDGWALSSQGLDLGLGRSAAHVSGTLRSNGHLMLEAVRIRLDSVLAEDLEHAGGIPLPASWRRISGHVLARGTGTDGIEVDAELAGRDSLGRPAAVRADGTLWLQPRPRVRFALEGDALRFAGAPPINLRADVAGDRNLLSIRGTAMRAGADTGAAVPGLTPRLRRLVRSARLNVDVDVLDAAGTPAVSGRLAVVESTAPDAGPIEWLVVEGGVETGDSARVDLVARADSLPLSLLPRPPALTELRGRASLAVSLHGSPARPRVSGRFRLHDAAAEAPAYGTGIDSADVVLRLTPAGVELDTVVAWRGAGVVRLGGALVFGERLSLERPSRTFRGPRADLRVVADSFPAADLDSLRAVISGHAEVTGRLDRPHVVAQLALIDGFAFEGRLAPSEPLDPGAPPLAELAARAPWPTTGRLADATRSARLAGDDPPLPLTAEIVVRATPGFRIIDEDSDLGTEGQVRVVIDSAGMRTEGIAAIRGGFYAYYGDRFHLVGGAFRLEGGGYRMAMLGDLRLSDRPLTSRRGGVPGWLERMPPTGILGYSAPGIVLELIRRRTALPATQTELASRLLFGTPAQPVDGAGNALFWRAAEADDLMAHRSAIQGTALALSYLSDELYDYIPIGRAYLRSGVVRTGSPHPGLLMVGSTLEATVLLSQQLELVGAVFPRTGAAPGAALRWVLRRERLAPTRASIELFTEPRFHAAPFTRGNGFSASHRQGLRVRWTRDY